MCKMLYVAAAQPLPLIPWQPSSPAFWVRELKPTEAGVRQQFSKPNVYYLGSHEGCACGFAYGIWPIDPASPFVESERAEAEAGIESVRRLSEYLTRAVADGPVELYACWDEEQECEPAERGVVAPTHIGGPAFQFENSQFLTVQQTTINHQAAIVPSLRG
jgi:hypothetical protein